MMTDSRESPRYTDSVRLMNEMGGLDMYFAAHGQEAAEWVRHIDALVPQNAAFFHEGFGVTTAVDAPSDNTRFGRELALVATKRGSVVLPGGYHGDITDTDAPRFQDGELGTLLRELSRLPDHLITEEHAVEYSRLNAIREMRAAVGSVAWLAVHLDSTDELSGRPVSLWGRHHHRSLPDMYDRLGVEPIDITVVDDGEPHEELPIHSRGWNEHELQAAYANAHRYATEFYQRSNQPGA